MSTVFSDNPHWPELVTSIYDALTDAFNTMNPTPDNPQQLAETATLRLINDFGGSQFYLPTSAAAKRLIRDRDIYQKAQTGQFSANELARQFKLSSKQINEIRRNQIKVHCQPL